MKYSIFSTNMFGTVVYGAMCKDETLGPTYKTKKQIDYCPMIFDSRQDAQILLDKILRSRLSDHLHFEIIENQSIQ